MAVGNATDRAVQGRRVPGKDQPRILHHPLAGRRRDHRPPRRHRPDGGLQHDRLEPLSDRPRPQTHSALGIGQRGRHRADLHRPAGDLHRRRLSRRDVSRHRVPDPAERHDDAERGHVHGGGRQRQFRRQAEVLHDGDLAIPGREAFRRAAGAQCRAALEAAAAADCPRRPRRGQSSRRQRPRQGQRQGRQEGQRQGQRRGLAKSKGTTAQEQRQEQRQEDRQGQRRKSRDCRSDPGRGQVARRSAARHARQAA